MSAQARTPPSSHWAGVADAATDPSTGSLPRRLARLAGANPQLTSPVGLGRVAAAGAFLGAALVSGVSLAAWSLVGGGGGGGGLTATAQFGLWLAFVAWYHMSEFGMTCLMHPSTVSYDSFVLTQQRAYLYAVAAAVVEFAVEAALFPGLKARPLLTCAGVAVVAAGQATRTAAMWQGGFHFTHLVQLRRREGHRLVTTGLYAVARHPSYMGWFAWSVGTQVLLANPVCAAAYAYAAYRFFDGRIREEEAALVEMFGEKYEEYRRRVMSGVPFVK